MSNEATTTPTTDAAKVVQPKRKTEADFARHAHMVAGSLGYVSPDGTCDNANVPASFSETHRNKQVCQINTVGVDGQPDGKTRWIATSDLHQCFWTVETKKALDAAKRNAKAKAGRAALKATLAVETAMDEEIVVEMEEVETVVVTG